MMMNELMLLYDNVVVSNVDNSVDCNSIMDMLNALLLECIMQEITSLFR